MLEKLFLAGAGAQYQTREGPFSGARAATFLQMMRKNVGLSANQIIADLRSANNGDDFACSRPDAGRDGHRRQSAALAARSAPP